MALELRQQLKLSQQLVMTPQLQQAIKLLQLSRLELVDMVQKELLENPLLEEKEDVLEAEAPPEDLRPAAERAAEAAEENGAEVRRELEKNADWEDYLGEFSSTARQAHARETESLDEGLSFEARFSAKPSLDGHLFWQLRLSDLTPEEMDIGEQVIGNLDSTGYLRASAEDIAQASGQPVEAVERVIARIQRFDPVGVAARTPQECLLVQMEVLDYDDPVLYELVREHLEDLEKRRYKPLARKFRIDMNKIKEYLDILASLDPMPGAAFGNEEPRYVSPDAYVCKFDGEWVIMLNEEGMPRLQLNSIYMDAVKSASKDKEYLQEKMRSAVWLMKSLFQRQRTLYKVVESISRFQRGFFEEGVTHLRPLILKDVAEDIQMHESTVSRITTSKYVATPHGIYELKFFFNSALGMDDGSQVGSESVKALIKQLIDGEDPKRPLSDEKIADDLKKRLKVNIARRTVAKYRTALSICSSSKRKQVF
jgi:RNA polymerase sigma-54 factor